MTTYETYEAGARVLINIIRESPNLIDKMKIMTFVKNLRNAQYKTTGEQRAKRLAENCENAAINFYIRAYNL